MPPLETFGSILEGTGEREISTTMAFVRILTMLLKDKNIGKHIVPIVPDEARTFGMEGLFRQIGIYSSVGQLYTPQDAETLMSYREDKKGQMLEEGINEAGSLCSWIAAGTAYSNHGINMVPFYIYYSMFGFQRVGDFIWAAGDIQARGFLLGATAGRTTLAGEGLQHQDGHSQLVATTVPNCVAYDPAYAYELAVIIHDGMQRMYVEQREHLLLHHGDERELRAAGAAAGRGAGDPQGRLSAADRRQGQAARHAAWAPAPSCASAWRRRKILDERLQMPADVFSVTSFSELRREALECERWNVLHPGAEPARCRMCSAAVQGRERAQSSPPPITCASCPTRSASGFRGRYVHARHRRLRPHPIRAPRCALLRGGSQLHRGGGAQGAGR